MDFDEINTGNYLYFTGITLAVIGAEGRKNLFSALEFASARGVNIDFDPNLRPKLWPSLEEMRFEIMRVTGLTTLIFSSFDDEARFFEDKCKDETLIRYELAGSNEIVLKDGASEILSFIDGERESNLPAPVLNVVDTTVAGDGFNVGFLAARIDGKNNHAALNAGADIASQIGGSSVTD